jgi:L-threonylcarbamoyladenylate synthase
MTKRVDDNQANRRAAGKLLREGGVVAYPTDTLYGLGASVKDEKAVARVFEIKGRPQKQGLPVLVASYEQLAGLVEGIPPEALWLTHRFWPGALSLVFRKQSWLSIVVSGGDTVAVRQPSHPSPLELIEYCGMPITGTSANKSGGSQPTTADEVLRQLDGLVDLVLDGGPCRAQMPSTILDLTVHPARLVREGAVSLEMLQEVVPVMAANNI